MSPPTDRACIVHISDSHIGPTRDFELHGYASYVCARRLVREINELPVRPDAVVHTGDVVADPSPEAFRLAAEVFGELNAPVYYVAGNHDSRDGIRRHLSMGAHEPLGPGVAGGGTGVPLTYAFEVKGTRCLVLDAVGPPEIEPRGRLSEEQLQIVHHEVASAASHGGPLAVFVHYPVWPLDSRWFDKNMLIENGAGLHDALLPARARLRGVFHGHVHMPLACHRDGILYSSVASTVLNFGGWPDDDRPRFLDTDPGFAVLRLLPEQTLVYHHSVPRR